jgi:hypothetical protein
MALAMTRPRSWARPFAKPLMDHPPVRGDLLPGLDKQDITGDHGVCGDLLHGSVAAHARLPGQRAAERQQAALGPILLIKAKSGIENDHGKNDGGIFEIAR